jgi:hypothetical protein
VISVSEFVKCRCFRGLTTFRHSSGEASISICVVTDILCSVISFQQYSSVLLCGFERALYGSSALVLARDSWLSEVSTVPKQCCNAMLIFQMQYNSYTIEVLSLVAITVRAIPLALPLLLLNLTPKDLVRVCGIARRTPKRNHNLNHSPNHIFFSY